MQVFYGIGQLVKARYSLKNVVAAIGVFDGVHLGHQDVIRRAVSAARRIKGASLVVTFFPHPVAVLHPERFSAYITTLSQRLERFAWLGVDACLVVPFTKRFAALRPVDFIEKYLVRSIRVKKIVVGDDFHFGHDRVGSIKLLEVQGRRGGFIIESQHIKKVKNVCIKSSYIRGRLANGDMEEVARLLGRPYSIRGMVVHGDGRGGRLGFPTANIKQENAIILPSGVYIAYVVIGGKRFAALFYIGRRPSFKSARARLSLEAHILDYRENLYGSTIDIELLKMLRSDVRFSDENALIEQIRNDVFDVRKYFSKLDKN